MEKLVALVNIQYKGRLYIPGEEIPEYTQEMADAWKRAGSVKVLTGEGEKRPEEDSGSDSGNNNPGTSADENAGEAADDGNAGGKPSDEVPDSKEPAKEGKKKK